MPDRFDCTKLVGALRGGGCHALAHGHGRGGSTPRPPGPWADPTVGSAVRQVKFESWLYQRVCPGGEGEWGAVYACGDLGGDGLRRLGGQTARVGTVGHDQPGQPCAISGGGRDLQSRTVRRCGRCLRGFAAHRPRWMDVVYGLGRLDVPADRRITSWLEAGDRQATHYSVPPCGLEGVHATLSIPGNGIPHHGSADARRERRD